MKGKGEVERGNMLLIVLLDFVNVPKIGVQLCRYGNTHTHTQLTLLWSYDRKEMRRDGERDRATRRRGGNSR